MCGKNLERVVCNDTKVIARRNRLYGTVDLSSMRSCLCRPGCLHLKIPFCLSLCFRFCPDTFYISVKILLRSSCVELIASQPWLLRTPSRSNRESIDPLSSYVTSLCPCDRPRSLTLFLARASCGEEQHSRSASSSFASPFVSNTSTGSTQTISWSAVPGSCFWQVQSFGRPSKRPCTLNILFPLDRLSQHPRFSLPREYSYKLRWLPSFCSTPACGQ